MRSRFRDVAVEALMVVFAVVVALAVEEWREEAGLRDFAARAERSVVAELRANLEEMEAAEASIRAVRDTIGVALRAEDPSVLGLSIGFDIPDLSAAAWNAAQNSQGGPYLDYDWVIRVARVYEAAETYERLGDQAVDAVAALIGPSPSLESLRVLFGRLSILADVHGQLEERIRDLLAESGDP